MSEIVECVTLDGQRKVVRKSKLILRPAAYAIILHNQRILLLKLQHTGKYHLPGGGIEVGERIVNTLKREVQEETGIEIEVGELVHFEELFFYYDPSGKAYHGMQFYYLCQPKTLVLLDDGQVNDGSAEKPRWVKVNGLRSQDFQIHGKIILSLCNRVEKGHIDDNIIPQPK